MTLSSFVSGAGTCLDAVYFFCLILVLIPFSATQNARAATKLKDLPPVYRHWVEVEVPYIISTTERKDFLSLTH
ncbi:MAG: hypothetical protein WDM87_16585 [Terracidiphilus sp.]